MDNLTEIILTEENVVAQVEETSITTLEVQHTSSDIVSEISDNSDTYVVEVQIVDGADGKSAYQVWLDAGNTGTVDDFIAFLAGTRTEVIQERLTGAVNGLNDIFYTTYPYQPGSIMIFINGLKESHITEIDSETIQLDEAPSNDGFEDLVEAYYIKQL